MNNNDQKIREIGNKIAEELNVFKDAVYPGEAVPKGFLKVYAKALMCQAPAVHKVWTDTLYNILNKKEEELSLNEVGVANNIIRAAEFRHLYPNPTVALEENKKFENLLLEFNYLVKVKESELLEKKTNMMNLAGVNTRGSKLISLT